MADTIHQGQPDREFIGEVADKNRVGLEAMRTTKPSYWRARSSLAALCCTAVAWPCWAQGLPPFTPADPQPGSRYELTYQEDRPSSDPSSVSNPCSRGGLVGVVDCKVTEPISELGLAGSSQGTGSVEALNAQARLLLSITPALRSDGDNWRVTLLPREESWQVDSGMPAGLRSVVEADRALALSNLGDWSVTLDQGQVETLTQAGALDLSLIHPDPFANLGLLSRPNAHVAVRAIAGSVEFEGPGAKPEFSW